MNLQRIIVVTVFTGALLIAIPIERFKSKNGVRFNNFGVSMKAKIINFDCNYILGFGKNSRKVCRALAQHKMKGKRDQNIHLIFDKRNASKLKKIKNKAQYHFVSCIYTHKRRMMSDCTIK